MSRICRAGHKPQQKGEKNAAEVSTHGEQKAEVLFTHVGLLAESGSQEQRTARMFNSASLTAGFSQGQGGRGNNDDNPQNQKIFEI